jgi:glycosyltransferase involved in cell wall biosynthesis
MSRTILSVAPRDELGGAERAARELHETYVARGHDAWLAAGRVTKPGGRVLSIPGREARSPWARSWMAVADQLPRGGAAGRVARALRGPVAEPMRAWRRARGEEDLHHPGTARLLDIAPRRPEVLHLHNLHGGYFDLRMLPAISNAVPTIATLHDAWLLSGHCAHSFSCGRWESGCGSCPALWIYPAVPRDRTAGNWNRKRAIYSASRLFAATPSAWLADRVKRSMLMPAVRELRVIPGGVDTRRFAPADRGAARTRLGLDPSRPLAIVFSDALHDRTWRDAEAFRLALARLGERAAAAQWVAIGEAGPDLRYGGVKVRRVGRVEGDAAMASWYQAADLYVHPARADTFPMMVLEAMACGTPVIASRIGGIPEQVRDGVTGLLAEPHDGAALARAIDSFFTLREAERSAMGANAAAEVADKFTLERSADAYLAWMDEIVSRGGGA